MRYLATINFIIGSIALMMGILLCIQNDSGHSGVDPIRDGSLCFLPIVVIAIICVISTRFKSIISWFSFIIGCSGFGFGFYIHHTGVMQQYNYWLRRGMLDQNSYSLWLLLGYLFAILAALGLVYFVFLKKRGTHF